MPRVSHETHADFGFRSELLDVRKITKLLGIEPTRAWNKGDLFESRTGIYARPWGVWGLWTVDMVRDREIGPHIERMLHELEPKVDIIRRIAQDMQATRLIYFWWNSPGPTAGYSVPSPMMLRLCALCDTLNFTFRYHEESPA